MAAYNKNFQTSSMSASTETISFYVDKDLIQDSTFQEFVEKLERSQDVIIITNANHGMIIINGKQSSVKNSKVQIQSKIDEISSESTFELSIAKKNFLENFGQKILNTIRKEAGINSASIVNDKLELSGKNAAITKIKSYLEKTLYEKNVSITYGLKQHLEKNCYGRMWKEFSNKYCVGTTFQEVNKYNNTQKKGLRGTECGGYQRGNCHPGQRGRGRFTEQHLQPNVIPDADTSKNNINDQYENEAQEKGDNDDDDNNSEFSDSGTSVSSKFSIDIVNTMSFNESAQQPIEVALCSDSEVSLSNAISELQSYSLYIESWAITEDELKFILKQQQRGKPMENNMSIRERSINIKYYLRHLAQTASIHIYIYYTRGMWHVKVSGLKSDVHSALFKIKSYLNDVVDTEVHIPISGAMAFFLRRKASSDINKLGKIHNIKIIFFTPPRRADNTNEDDNDYHCLKLIGPVSRINLAQTAVENFLENLSEQEKNFPCGTWDISKDISLNVKELLKKIRESDDYKAVGFVKFFNSAIERRQTTPKVTITVVGLNEERANDVIEQCKDIFDGYIIWGLSLDEYRALYNILLVQKRPSIYDFRKEWDTQIKLESQTNTIIIPARSKAIADEIKETLQNLAGGKANPRDTISIIISIEPKIRRFVYQAIKSLLEEAKTEKVNVDSKNRMGLTLRGRSEIVTSVQTKINSIIQDIKQKLVTHRFKLPSVESELLRANSYKILIDIERETNTIIRDVKADAKISKLNANNQNDDTSLNISCVVNNRGQTILVQKGDITKVKNVDAIVNAANGSLHHAGGVDKAISDAAGPALDQECEALIAKNRGVAISTGEAVKTTAGRLPYKSVIHAIGPQYRDGNHQERPLLFSSILSSLRLAEEEEYHSIALPAISAVTYGFPLQDCTNIVIHAVKQFFADFQESHVRKVILLAIDDVAYNSFAREVVNDHTNTDEDNNGDLMNYNLSSLTAKWCWKDNNGENIYDDTQTRQIEAEFQEYLQTFTLSTSKINVETLKWGFIASYSINFLPNLKQLLSVNPNALNSPLVCGYQMRESTGFKQDIIRYPVQQKKYIVSDAYHPKPLDTYHLNVQFKEDDWDLISTNSAAIKQAEATIRKAIVSAMISETLSVHLNEDIDAQDILKMEVDKDDELDIPKEWGEQEEQCKLVELPKNHSDFIRIEKRMKETMNNVKIDKIERVQNLRIWNHYAFRRHTLKQELSHKPNLQIEMELFHGTRTAQPSEIYNGEYGFDMTFCTSGLWGIGTYFSMNASYSCQSYSHLLPDGKREVFLAQVLTGEVYDYKKQTDPTLRRPPKKHENVSGARYNSVSGEAGGTKVYIIYEHRIAYPTFLITFTQ